MSSSSSSSGSRPSRDAHDKLAEAAASSGVRRSERPSPRSRSRGQRRRRAVELADLVARAKNPVVCVKELTSRYAREDLDVVVKELASLVTDAEDPIVRLKAMDALRRVAVPGTAVAVKALVSAVCHDLDEDVRQLAAFHLAEVGAEGDEETVGVLRRRLKVERDEAVCRCIVRSLGMLATGSDEALAAVLGGLLQEDGMMRSVAGDVLLKVFGDADKDEGAAELHVLLGNVEEMFPELPASGPTAAPVVNGTGSPAPSAGTAPAAGGAAEACCLSVLPALPSGWAGRASGEPRGPPPRVAPCSGADVGGKAASLASPSEEHFFEVMLHETPCSASLASHQAGVCGRERQDPMCPRHNDVAMSEL